MAITKGSKALASDFENMEIVSSKSVGGVGYIRYASGLQIVWGSGVINTFHTFVQPFSANPNIVANDTGKIGITGISGAIMIGFPADSSDITTGFIPKAYTNGAFVDSTWSIHWIAIGPWK